MRKSTLLCLTLSLGACNSGPPDYKSFLSSLQKVLCQHFVDCGFFDASYEAQCETALNDNAATIDSSTYTYDSGNASRCLDAIKSSLNNCYNDINLNSMMVNDACKSVAVGKTAAGGSCPNGAECAPGTACGQSFAGTTCTSQCKTRIAIGAPCDNTVPCVEGAFCQNQTCTALLDSGGACAGSGQCKSGLVCIPTMSNSLNGTCGAPGNAGSNCSGFEGRLDCVAGLTCSSTSMSCAAAAKAGEACAFDSDCGERLVCDSKVCVTPIAKGGSCPNGSGCIGPTQCMNGACVAPPSLGEACTANGSGCFSGYCNTTSGKCEARIAVGAACDPTITSQQCVGTAMCDSTSKTCKLCQ
jgi:hypothetical protein